MEISDETKALIIADILAEVDKGFCTRIGWHVEQALDLQQFGSKPGLLGKIESQIVQNTRYASRRHGSPDAHGDYEIVKNPNYKSKWYDFKVQGATALLTLIVGILLWLIDNRSKHQEIQELKNRIDSIEVRTKI